MTNVLVFGYSDNPERYSYMAFELLKDYGHKAVAFNPRTDDFKSLAKSFDTITLYVNPTIGEKFSDGLLKIKTKRVIFNPGTENPVLEKKFQELGVEIVIGCTLVMLKTNQY